MQFHIEALKERARQEGRRITWDDIARETGIRKPMLFEIAKGRARTLRPEYLDALCTFFGVTVAELMSAEPIDLPLRLNLRPDRRGKPIGRRRGQSAP